MSEFANYTDAILSAFRSTLKEQDIINKKQEILDSIYNFHNLVPSTILFVGFNPAIVAAKKQKVYVTDITQEAQDYLTSKGVQYTYIPWDELQNHTKSFDVVVALDEYFTFARSDHDQQNSVRFICSLAKEFVISTLRDYKNQDFRDREFSIPAVVRSSAANQLYNEFHDWAVSNKGVWATTVYEIISPPDTLTTYGSFGRRAMYFKQLAKFGMDAGACGFTVHKNLMYKSMIRRNYEHVVSIRFDE